MNAPRRPTLPKHLPDIPLPAGPDPRVRPDERKEGGPDFGKEVHQREKAKRDRRDTLRETDKEPPAD